VAFLGAAGAGAGVAAGAGGAATSGVDFFTDFLPEAGAFIVLVLEVLVLDIFPQTCAFKIGKTGVQFFASAFNFWSSTQTPFLFFLKCNRFCLIFEA
jgi:CBS domain containing-hemolysin-like protein